MRNIFVFVHVSSKNTTVSF